MPEWSIGAVSKTVVPLREPRVRIPVFPQPKRTKVGLIKTNHGLSTSSVVFLCPDANNAGRTKAHENGIPDIYLLQIGYTLLKMPKM